MTLSLYNEMDGTIASDAPERPLVAVAGPTGSGKSGLALDIAEAFAGEVVNCDSLQVYRHFDIGPPSWRWRSGAASRTTSSTS